MWTATALASELRPYGGTVWRSVEAQHRISTNRLTSDLGEQARRLGATCNAPDLIIAACARLHGAKLEHSDSDFDRIAHLK